jgi:hypothetical protein
MTTILVTCRQCGQEYPPTRDDVLRGPDHYRRCPRCRPPRPQELGRATSHTLSLDIVVVSANAEVRR